MTKSLALIERLRTEWGIRVTVTHLVTKALALAIAKNPRTNVKVRFWGKLEQRESVDITVLVAGEGGRDLSAHRIAAADRVPLRELSRQIIEAGERIRRDEDPQFRQSREMVRRVPWWLMRPFLSLASLCMNELHLDLSKIGLPVDLFGVGMVTSLGMHGIDEGFAPLTPIGRIMVDVLVPRVRERVWAEEGKITIRPTLKLCATFDHRVIDGVQAATLSGEIQSLLADPERLL
jgi:pyruvate/2-oxoglutarate dehydrogenase complex dihydrolipoamide acyltransferase (E2) component